MADVRPREELIERIRKLMEKSVGKGCTEAESQTAMAMAGRIMTEHNLSMSEVVAHESRQDEGWVTETVDAVKRMSTEVELAANICRSFFFVQWLYRDRCDSLLHRRMTEVRFFGSKDNVETSRWVYQAIRASFESLWLEYKIGAGVRHTERRAYVSGVARGFHEKMSDERKAMAAEREIAHVPGDRPIQNLNTALAVIGNKLEQAYKAAYPDLKTASSRAPIRGSASTFDAGRAAGRNLNLNRPLGNAKPKGLPGK